MLKGKKIVLGITGSIAAYKSCLIIRQLIKAGAEVQVVITPSGKEFITPLTLSTLTQKPVISEFFNQRDGSWNSHVSLGLWADAMLIAPCTASTIGKMANGIADNMLLTTYLSMKAPVFIAPAMDLDMYAHPATQDNLKLLKKRGVNIIDSATGFLASTLEGKGRMQEPEAIVESLDRYFSKNSGDLKGERVLITAGPTYEKIDPVRFIGNYSSGKMGLALAKALAGRGANVELVLGPCSQPLPDSPLISVTHVESAEDMYNAATKVFETCTAAILCAAVADYRPEVCASSKIKREKTGSMNLHLVPTQDIAAALGKMKSSGQKLCGFALETDDEVTNAQNKLTRKNLDMIVMNSLRDKGAGFQCDTNKVTIITSKDSIALPLLSKDDAAEQIINALYK